MMGSDEGDDDEQPVHEQCFDAPFWIDKTEVTNAQFRSVGCENTSSEPNQPRNCVNWFEARDFCASRDARLPTEAEWEYAARGVSNWEYPWGDEFVAENAVFGDNSGGKTANVGSRPGGASWAGALDMSGNVWEWVSSLYVDYEYNLDKSESDIDNTSARALRGGSFGVDSFILRAAFRLWLYPVGPSFNWGFRCSSSLK
jgi:formylglycine-generating enzyme required for sulfatase activity